MIIHPRILASMLGLLQTSKETRGCGLDGDGECRFQERRFTRVRRRD